jgi:hypothetical protein
MINALITMLVRSLLVVCLHLITVVVTAAIMLITFLVVEVLVVKYYDWKLSKTS